MQRRVGQVWTAASAAVVAMVLTSAPAWAAGTVPDPAPDSSMPGAALIGSMLGGLKWGALAASVGGILGGGIAVGVGHFGNNYGAAAAGRKWVLGGIGAAALAGMAHAFATQIYNAS